ncbi:hypothetical protein DIPPA_27876 [Diplonema papillatum]|nr:hypothetical protein DIPPA_27876 [Diplonema papillatum]
MDEELSFKLTFAHIAKGDSGQPRRISMNWLTTENYDGNDGCSAVSAMQPSPLTSGAPSSRERLIELGTDSVHDSFEEYQNSDSSSLHSSLLQGDAGR